jgi:hypothetical protein
VFHDSGPLIFNFVKVGESSAPKTATITNDGSGQLEITGVEVPNHDFIVQADGCEGASLSSGQSCTVSVVFAPHIAGTRLSSIVFHEVRGACTDYVSLAGSGTDAAASASAIAHAANCIVSTSTSTVGGPTQVITAPGPGQKEDVETPGAAGPASEGDILQFVTPPKCVISGRHIRLDLHTSKADQIVAARVYINGHLDKAIRDPSISIVIVDLPHNHLRRYRVQVIANIAPGGTLGLTRYFSVCPPPPKHGSKRVSSS